MSGTGKKWRPWLCAIAVAAASGSAGCTATLERPEFDARTLSARVVGLRSEARASYALIQKHIEDVGYQLAHSGAPICGEAVAPLLGASLARRNDFVLHAKKAQVEAAFGVGDRVKVFAVAGGVSGRTGGIAGGRRDCRGGWSFHYAHQACIRGTSSLLFGRSALQGAARRHRAQPLVAPRAGL